MLFCPQLDCDGQRGLLVAGLDDEDYGNQVGKPPGQTSVMTYPEALRLAQQVSLASTLSTTDERAGNLFGPPQGILVLHPRATRMEKQDAVQIK